MQGRVAIDGFYRLEIAKNRRLSFRIHGRKAIPVFLFVPDILPELEVYTFFTKKGEKTGQPFLYKAGRYAIINSFKNNRRRDYR